MPTFFLTEATLVYDIITDLACTTAACTTVCSPPSVCFPPVTMPWPPLLISPSPFPLGATGLLSASASSILFCLLFIFYTRGRSQGVCPCLLHSALTPSWSVHLLRTPCPRWALQTYQPRLHMLTATPAAKPRGTRIRPGNVMPSKPDTEGQTFYGSTHMRMRYPE